MKLNTKYLIVILSILSLTCESFSFEVTRIIANEAGTVGGGGGSYYKNKPIESYYGNPKQTKAYKEHLKPMMAKLKTFRSVPLDLLFDYVLTKKTWYFVPGPLQQLPVGATGAFVSDNQGILQNFKAVWVNIDIFNDKEALTQIYSRYQEQIREIFQEELNASKELTLSELQAMMILHELFMGIKILKFESDMTICKILTTLPESESCLGIRDKRPMGKKSLHKLLQKEDYDDIRYATIKLFNGFSSMTEDNLLSMMANNNFSNDIYQFVPSSALQKITYKDLINAVKASVLTNGLPKYEYKEEKREELLFMDAFIRQPSKPTTVIWESSGPCNIKFSNFSDQGFNVTFNKDGQSYGPYNLIQNGGEPSSQSLREDWTFMKSYEMSLSDFNSQPFGYEREPKSGNKRAPQVGDSYHDISFNLIGPSFSKHISAIYISELVCISTDPMVWREKEGSEFQCSNLKAIPVPIKLF